jgi:hypothetical protein
MCMFCVDFDAAGIQLTNAPQNTSRKAKMFLFLFFVLYCSYSSSLKHCDVLNTITINTL